MDWIIQNKEWAFSGFGFGIFSLIIGLLFMNKKNKVNQTIKSGNHSTNIQGGNDVNVNLGDRNDGR